LKQDKLNLEKQLEEIRRELEATKAAQVAAMEEKQKQDEELKTLLGQQLNELRLQLIETKEREDKVRADAVAQAEEAKKELARYEAEMIRMKQEQLGTADAHITKQFSLIDEERTELTRTKSQWMLEQDKMRHEDEEFFAKEKANLAAEQARLRHEREDIEDYETATRESLKKERAELDKFHEELLEEKQQIAKMREVMLASRAKEQEEFDRLQQELRDTLDQEHAELAGTIKNSREDLGKFFFLKIYLYIEERKE